MAKYPLEQAAVGLWKLSNQWRESGKPFGGLLVGGLLLKAGQKGVGEDGVRQLPQEELEQAGHHGRLRPHQRHRLPIVVERLQLHHLGLDPGWPKLQNKQNQ